MSAVHTTGPLPTEKQLKASLKSLKYTQHGLLSKHITAAAEAFPNIKPSIKECTYADPSIRGATLIQMAGTVPSGNSEAEQLIPVRIWLNKNYPKDRPIIYINLSPNMTFSDVEYIKADGRVELLKIMRWKEGKSDLCTLIHELHSKFNKRCPVNPLKLRSSFGQFQFRHLKNAHSTLSLRSFDDIGKKGMPTPTSAAREYSRENELAQLRSEVQEQKTEIESLQETLEEVRGKVVYYRNQASEMEEKLRAQRTAVRGSFATGVFDALLLQHNSWNESEEVEEYRLRMEKMVTDLTEAREKIGILQADKEEYQERLGVLATEYEHIKHAYCKMVKERRYLIDQHRARRSDTQTDSEESEDERGNLPTLIIEEVDSGKTSQIKIVGNCGFDLPDIIEEVAQEAANTKVQHEAEQDHSCIDDTCSDLCAVAEHTRNDDQAEKMAKVRDEGLKEQNEQLKKQIESLTKKTHSQAAQIESLQKQVISVKEEGEESTGMMKKLLDDALRKIRKFEYYADKEEQLEKQKQFLQAKLDRSMTDRLQAEKKLNDENWETRQKLKEALNKVERLETELRSIERPLSLTASEVSYSSADDDPMIVQRSQGPQCEEAEDMTSILDHLDVLLSK